MGVVRVPPRTLVLERLGADSTILQGGHRSSGNSSGHGLSPQWFCGGHERSTIPWDGGRKPLLVVLPGMLVGHTMTTF